MDIQNISNTNMDEKYFVHKQGHEYNLYTNMDIIGMSFCCMLECLLQVWSVSLCYNGFSVYYVNPNTCPNEGGYYGCC